MTYYRLAIQDRQTAKWSWKTTPVTSLKAVFELLRCYRTLLPHERIRVFTAPSKQDLHELLSRENNGLVSGSATATQFLQERNLLAPEQAHSAPQPSDSAQSAQQSENVATWAKDVWETFVATGPAHTAQQGAPNASSSAVGESIPTTGAPSSPGMSVLDMKRLAIELGPGGDHDVPYIFVLPFSIPQVRAWMRLLARVQRGELEL